MSKKNLKGGGGGGGGGAESEEAKAKRRQRAWEWSFYDRSTVTLEMAESLRPCFTSLLHASESKMGELWPPDDAGWDYETGRPYPYHLLVFKFRQWRRGLRPFSPYARHDIMNYLSHLDDGNLDAFYRFFAPRQHAGYRPSEGTPLYRVHTFLKSITNMTTFAQRRRHEIESSAAGLLLPSATAATTHAPRLNGPGAHDDDDDERGGPEIKSLSVLDIVLDYDSPCSILFFYESATPEERRVEIDAYNRSNHPKEPDRSLSARPTLSPAEQREAQADKLRYQQLESLFYD